MGAYPWHHTGVPKLDNRHEDHQGVTMATSAAHLHYVTDGVHCLSNPIGAHTGGLGFAH